MPQLILLRIEAGDLAEDGAEEEVVVFDAVVEVDFDLLLGQGKSVSRSYSSSLLSCFLIVVTPAVQAMLRFRSSDRSTGYFSDVSPVISSRFAALSRHRPTR